MGSADISSDQNIITNVLIRDNLHSVYRPIKIFIYMQPALQYSVI